MNLARSGSPGSRILSAIAPLGAFICVLIRAIINAKQKKLKHIRAFLVRWKNLIAPPQIPQNCHAPRIFSPQTAEKSNKNSGFPIRSLRKKSPGLMREFGKKRIVDRKSDLRQQADETAEKFTAHFPNVSGAVQRPDSDAKAKKISQKCAEFADALIFRQISSVHPGEKTQVLGK